MPIADETTTVLSQQNELDILLKISTERRRLSCQIGVRMPSMEKTYARDDHEELPDHVDAPVLVAKNDSDDFGKLRGELQKVTQKLEEIAGK